MIQITRIIAAFTLLFSGVFWFWFQPGPLVTALYFFYASIAAAIGLGIYISIFSRKDQQAQLIAAEIHKEKALRSDVMELVDQLKSLNATDAAQQGQRLLGMLEDYRQVIEQKLAGTTITLSTYSQETRRIFKIAYKI